MESIRYNILDKSYMSSPVKYSEQSRIPLQLTADIYSNKDITSLFVSFLEDLLFSLDVSQISQSIENTETEWSEAVRNFADNPCSIRFVRTLSHFFSVKRSLSAESALNHLAEAALDNKTNVINYAVHKDWESLSQENQFVKLNRRDFISPAFSVSSFGSPLQPDIRHIYPPRENMWGVPHGIATLGGYRPERPLMQSAPIMYEHASKSEFSGQNASKMSTEKDSPSFPVKRMLPPSRKCKFPTCEKSPNFNSKGAAKGIFCATHKLEGMIDVKHKRCEFRDCTSHPSCNYVDLHKGKYCSVHKLEGMVNVRNRRCGFENCIKNPHFNYKGESTGKFCVEHKIEGMVDVTNRRCEHPDCCKRPTFNYKGTTKGRYCSVHQLKDMVRVASAPKKIGAPLSEDDIIQDTPKKPEESPPKHEPEESNSSNLKQEVDEYSGDDVILSDAV